jgi:RNA recognition motif-containing protein
MGNNRIFVGSLSFDATEEDLKQAFEACGTVVSTFVPVDKMTGRKRGFGFVEMSTPEEAAKAIAELNGKEIHGRPVALNEAQPKVPRQ